MLLIPISSFDAKSALRVRMQSIRPLFLFLFLLHFPLAFVIARASKEGCIFPVFHSFHCLFLNPNPGKSAADLDVRCTLLVASGNGTPASRVQPTQQHLPTPATRQTVGDIPIDQPDANLLVPQLLSHRSLPLQQKLPPFNQHRRKTSLRIPQPI